MDVDNIENMKTKCRGCLGNEENMISLFEGTESLLLCENLILCAKIDVTEGDGGPTKICNTCLQELTLALKFREKCENSDRKIKFIVNGLLEKTKLDDVNKSNVHRDSSETDIKLELNNDDDNSYDFFDGSINLKKEFLDTFKIEFANEDVRHKEKCSKSSLESKSNNLFQETILKRKRKKRKLHKKECLDFIPLNETSNTVPKKRGRKPKVLQNMKYVHDEDILNVLTNELQCSICEKLFADTKNYKIHIKTHSKSRDHTCDQCGKQFKYKDNLKVHWMTHSGEKPFECDLCPKRFSKKDNLSIHRRRHLKERNYSCHECGSAHYTSYELKTHMRSHSGEKPHVCTLCGKRFTAKNNLHIHQRSHTGEKPHVCTVCGKQFTSKNILSIHCRTHTGEKPYICSVCGKRFAANKLAVHMRTHTGEKPHVCPLCGKQFSASNVLVIHMRRHTGEKPYECKICGQTYGHTQSLNKHMRKQHKIVTNALQLQMQQINEAHRALLEGKDTNSTLKSLEIHSVPSAILRKPQTSLNTISVDHHPHETEENLQNTLKIL